jgi:dienelactone hydrolase
MAAVARSCRRPGENSRVPRKPLTIALFHSMFGLRPVETAAADRLRAAGHRVVRPDLFAGSVAGGDGHVPAPEDGFALMDRIGWDVIVGRARDAVRDLPPDSVLFGFSMGVGVVGSLWPERLDAAGVVFFHATTPVPAGIQRGTPVQAHVADGDAFAPADQLAEFRRGAALAGADAAVHTYRGAGHFFTDASLPDHDLSASAHAWQHVDELLANLH